MRKRTAAVATLLAVALAAVIAQAKPAGNAPANSPLEAARQRVKAALSTNAAASTLEREAMSLPLHDAVNLLSEFLKAIPPEARPDIAALGGSLALMAGRFSEAASFLSVSAEKKPSDRLLAARCLLAAGDVEGARKLLSAAASQEPKSPALDAEAKLVLAWADCLGGDWEKAYLTAKAGSSKESPPKVRRESYLLLWLVLSAPGTVPPSAVRDQATAASVRRALESEFPESPELAWIVKGAGLSAAPWILALPGLQPSSGEAQAPSAAVQPPSAPDAKAQGGGPQLQVGWFSRKENADALMETLKKKGFAAFTDAQKSSTGEPRWAVIVEAKGDWTATQAKLKDAGYESYLLP